MEQEITERTEEEPQGSKNWQGNGGRGMFNRRLHRLTQIIEAGKGLSLLLGQPGRNEQRMQEKVNNTKNPLQIEWT
jgi:hypothetical protein